MSTPYTRLTCWKWRTMDVSDAPWWQGKIDGMLHPPTYQVKHAVLTFGLLARVRFLGANNVGAGFN